VTKNLVMMRRRTEARRRRHEAAVAHVTRHRSPDDLAARLETQRLLIEAVQDLREPYRSTVVARFYDGLKPRQIAKRDGVPVETVRTRLQRAVKQLKARLDERHGGDRRAWMVALLPFALPKGFLPAGGAAGAAAGGATGVAVKAGFAAVTLAAAAALVVVWSGTTGRDAPTPERTPAPELTPSKPRPEEPGPGPIVPGPADPEEYLRRINAGENAYDVGLEIAGLAPERGREIVLAIYGRIERWGRRHEVQKAFVNSGHPYALAVVDLATGDESEWVRDAAFENVMDLFFRNFRGDPQGYREWIARYGGLALADALRESAREYVNRLRRLEGESLELELGRIRERTRRLWDHVGLDLATEMTEAGILELIEDYLGSPETRSRVVAPALLWLRELGLDEERLTRIVAALLAGPAARDSRFVSRFCREIGRREHAWAVAPLLDVIADPAGMSAASYSEVVSALGGLGDLRAIPALIGVVSERSASESIRWQAHRSLLALTRLKLDPAQHEAGWWRAWWKKNRVRYPDEVKGMEIPVIHPPR
jgi:hypothetical protein